MALRVRPLLRLSSSVRLYSNKTDQIQVKKVHRPTGTFGPLTAVTDEDRQFELGPALGRDHGGAPLVLIFGWAGATHKVQCQISTQLSTF